MGVSLGPLLAGLQPIDYPVLAGIGLLLYAWARNWWERRNETDEERPTHIRKDWQGFLTQHMEKQRNRPLRNHSNRGDPCGVDMDSGW